MSINVTNHPERREGTGVYRTIFVVEVLSNEPVSGLSLSELAHEVNEGGSSGLTDVLDEREISKSDMAKFLREQGSDPEFLLGEDAWVYELGTGDEVTWNDPDEGIGTRKYVIQNIKFDGDVVKITDMDGSFLECYPSELE